MVDMSKAMQFQGFDINDYTLIDSSANPLGANNIGIYVAGTDANNAAISPIAFALAQIPVPAPGGPPTNIGPQYPWAYEGSGPFPVAVTGLAAAGLTNPLNVAPVHKTLFRVITNDIYVYFLDMKLATVLYTFWQTFPALQGLPGTFAVPNWLVPRPVLLQADIGQYEFERKWIWLLYVRAVADADADVHVYMEG